MNAKIKIVRHYEACFGEQK